MRSIHFLYEIKKKDIIFEAIKITIFKHKSNGESKRSNRCKY